MTSTRYEEDDSAVSDDGQKIRRKPMMLKCLRTMLKLNRKWIKPMHPPPQKKQKTTSNAVAGKQKQSSISSFFVKRS